MIKWFIVYRVVNKKTSKVYVSYHITEDIEWPRGYDPFRPNVASLNHDIALYGAASFDISVIARFATKEEADRILNRTLSEHGENTYNHDINKAIAVGHSGKSKYQPKRSREQKERERILGVRAGINNGFYGKQHTEENIENIRNHRKTTRWAVNPMANSEIQLSKSAPLPPGYIEGRLCRAEKTYAKQLRKYKQMMGLSQ